MKKRTQAKNRTAIRYNTVLAVVLNDLLCQFDNGLGIIPENNAVFANCIEHLIRGGGHL